MRPAGVGMLVAAGCLGAVLLVAAAVGGFGYLLFGSMRRSGAYQDALRALRGHPAAREVLGEPMEAGWLTTGNINVTPAAGEAKLAIPVSGPRGRGTLYVEAVKRAGKWQMNLLELAPSAGARINLLGLAGWGDAALREGCDAGNGAACHTLGFRLFKGDPAGRPEAARLLRRACDAGEAQGCSDLGACHENGWGVPVDLAQAAALYQRACDGQSASGCTYLGHMLDQGRGVAEDPVRAAAAYQKGCEGDTADCSYLGEMYETGRGVAQDEVRAAKLYTKACDARDARGCSHLGVLHMRGAGGVARDPVRGAELFTRACDGGYAVGCSNLAIAHTEGEGVARDPVRAAALFKQACDGGLTDACRRSAAAGRKESGSRPGQP